jgi:hypothetical protein
MCRVFVFGQYTHLGNALHRVCNNPEDSDERHQVFKEYWPEVKTKVLMISTFTGAISAATKLLLLWIIVLWMGVVILPALNSASHSESWVFIILLTFEATVLLSFLLCLGAYLIYVGSMPLPHKPAESVSAP